MGRTVDVKQALGCPSCGCGSCQKLKQDKEKKSRRFSLCPTFLGGRWERKRSEFLREYQLDENSHLPPPLSDPQSLGVGTGMGWPLQPVLRLGEEVVNIPRLLGTSACGNVRFGLPLLLQSAARTLIFF